MIVVLTAALSAKTTSISIVASILAGGGSFNQMLKACKSGYTTTTPIQNWQSGFHIISYYVGRYSGYSHSDTSHVPVLQPGFGAGEDMLRQQVRFK
jgi:hypothetical protein